MAAVLGIDIGGSGIKGNLVDPEGGRLLSERHKIATPVPAIPEAVAAAVARMVATFDYHGPVGCTFPAIVKRGVTLSAANVDARWIGLDAAGLLTAAVGQPVTVVNDADAAGLAEMRFGAGRERQGLVILLTFGTGIGSSIFINGVLVPNTELGHLHFDGHQPVESWAAARVRKERELSWKAWGRRVDALLSHLSALFSPDLFIIGGGVSRQFDQFSPHLTVAVETIPASFANEAGIVGAALVAHG
jgi:polyphosphate glucokinase